MRDVDGSVMSIAARYIVAAREPLGWMSILYIHRLLDEVEARPVWVYDLPPFIQRKAIEAFDARVSE